MDQDFQIDYAVTKEEFRKRAEKRSRMLFYELNLLRSANPPTLEDSLLDILDAIPNNPHYKFLNGKGTFAE